VVQKIIGDAPILWILRHLHHLDRFQYMLQMICSKLQMGDLNYQV